MRHLFGVVLALVLSADLFFGGGWGVSAASAAGRGPGLLTLHSLLNPDHLVPIAALAGTGLLLGIALAVHRISPLATGLPGLVAVLWSGLAIMQGHAARAFIPDHGSRFAHGFTTLLSGGALAVLGFVMIVPLFIPSRWRGPETEVAYDAENFEDEGFSVNDALGLAP